ncbi:acyl carrier protein [Eubacteriales bacterium OttesenSCG-928-N14]|nr:acyl carrier protein [Eubacteriales bacterium OttesenSCG-928-N14]
MTMSLEQVKSVIAKQLMVDEAEINENSRLVEDLKADSLNIVELVMELESEYNLEIPDEDLEKLSTVGDIVTYINAHN